MKDEFSVFSFFIRYVGGGILRNLYGLLSSMLTIYHSSAASHGPRALANAGVRVASPQTVVEKGVPPPTVESLMSELTSQSSLPAKYNVIDQWSVGEVGRWLEDRFGDPLLAHRAQNLQIAGDRFMQDASDVERKLNDNERFKKRRQQLIHRVNMITDEDNESGGLDIEDDTVQ